MENFATIEMVKEQLQRVVPLKMGGNSMLSSFLMLAFKKVQVWKTKSFWLVLLAQETASEETLLNGLDEVGTVPIMAPAEQSSIQVIVSAFL